MPPATGRWRIPRTRCRCGLTAGYQTAHLGKYLNGYQGVADPDTEVAPGWDEWPRCYPRRYYGYNLAVNGDGEKFRNDDEDYSRGRSIARPRM